MNVPFPAQGQSFLATEMCLSPSKLNAIDLGFAVLSLKTCNLSLCGDVIRSSGIEKK